MRESASEYIEKNASTIDDQKKVDEAIQALSHPLGVIDWAQDGVASINATPFGLTFTLAPVAPEERPNEKPELEKADVYKISHAALSRSDRNRTLSFDELLPPDYSVYCAPRLSGVSSYVARENKRIVLCGDFAEPRILLAFLHEIGHIYEQQNPKEFVPEKNVNRNTFDQVDLGKKLLSERDAWACAFKKIKWFFDDAKATGNVIRKTDALMYAKHEALQSYVDSIQYQQEHRRQMQHFARDFLDAFDDDMY